MILPLLDMKLFRDYAAHLCTTIKLGRGQNVQFLQKIYVKKIKAFKKNVAIKAVCFNTVSYYSFKVKSLKYVPQTLATKFAALVY